MSNEKQNLEFEKIAAFLASPVGMWIAVGIVAAIVVGALFNTVLGWFQ